MIKTKSIQIIDVNDWDKLVMDTYKRVYSFQQQAGCRERSIFYLDIPSNEANDKAMNDSIPEKVNGEIMGVKLKTWLERDPEQPIEGQKYDWELHMFWERNFYPDTYVIANDLYKKGLIEAGKYAIDIDW